VREHRCTARRIRQFGGQILAREVQPLVCAGAPFGAVGHIMNNALVSNVHARASLARVAAQFLLSEEALIP
jgi:hypothetical protein